MNQLCQRNIARGIRSHEQCFFGKVGLMHNFSLKKCLNTLNKGSASYFIFLINGLYHSAGDVTRVSVMPRKVTVKSGDAENRCRGCRDKNR